MQLTSTKPTVKSPFKVLLDNSSRTFSGVLSDNDISEKSNGYVFNYHLVLNKVSVKGDICLINANFSLGARQGLEFKPVDIITEISELKKSYKKYKELADTNPSSAGEGKLTYMEIANAYKDNIEQLFSIQQPILEQIKLQIKDKINTLEHNNVVFVDFRQVKLIPFKNTG